MRKLGRHATLFVFFAAGCVQTGDLVEDFSLRHAIHSEFSARHGDLPHGKFARHYERGWKQGYYNASLGQHVVRPSLPAGVYLGRQYQSSQGSVFVDSWYAGYENGHTAYQEQCGQPTVGDYVSVDAMTELPTSAAPMPIPKRAAAMDPAAASAPVTLDADDLVAPLADPEIPAAPSPTPAESVQAGDDAAGSSTYVSLLPSSTAVHTETPQHDSSTQLEPPLPEGELDFK